MIEESAKVVSNNFIAPDIVHQCLYSPAVVGTKVEPGQFVNVSAGGIQEGRILRRPFSVASVKEGKILELVFRIRGEGTKFIAGRKPGDRMQVLGPLGKGFYRDRIVNGGSVALVAGGIGVAPLLFLAETLSEKQDVMVDFFYGASTETELVLTDRLSTLDMHLHLATDDGSAGFSGFVSDLFFEYLDQAAHMNGNNQGTGLSASSNFSGSGNYNRVFCVGPRDMMRVIGERCLKDTISCLVSVEERMGCGIGACMGCPIETRDQDAGGDPLIRKHDYYTMVCCDGPVFDVAEVVL